MSLLYLLNLRWHLRSNNHAAAEQLFQSELVDDDDSAPLISVPPRSNDSSNSKGKRSSRGAGRGGKGKTAKGQRKAQSAAENPVESTEEFDFREVEEGASDDNDDPAPETSGRKMARMHNAGNHAGKSAAKRPPASPLTATTKSKRSRKGTITQAVDDGSLLAQVTEAMQADETPAVDKGEAKQAQSTPEEMVAKTVTRPRPKLRPPPINVPISVPATSRAGVDMQSIGDPAESDEILASLNEPGGENSPGADGALALAALDGSTDRPRHTIPSPWTSLASAPAHDDIEEKPQVAHSRNLIQDSSDEETYIGSRSSRGLLAGTHGGVLGQGRDGTGGCGRVRHTFGTRKRTISRRA